VGSRPQSVAVGDFNGDGRADVATANYLSDNVSVLLGTGAGGSAPAVSFAVGTSPDSVAVGDFNGDGRADLVTANFGSSDVSVLVGDGAGGFAPAVSFAVGQGPNSVAVGDFNGDRRADLVTSGVGFNDVSVLLNQTSPATANLLDADTSTIEGSLGHWVPWFSSAASRSTAQAHGGAASMQVDVTAPYGWGVQLNNWPGFAASPGPMRISFWARLRRGSAGATMSVDWRNAAGTAIRTDTISVRRLTTTWQQASAGVVAPPGTARVTVELTGRGAAGHSLFLDDIVVAPVPSVLYAATSTR